MMSSSVQDGLVVAKLNELYRRFHHRYWEGPKFSSPAETVARGLKLGIAAPPEWEIWMEKARVPDSGNPKRMGLPLRAQIRYTADDVLSTPIEKLAIKIATVVAGLEAHEALEFSKFDSEYAVDPHGSYAELKKVGDDLAGIIASTATRS